MKKLLVLLLALCMVFTLCACGNDADDKKTDGDKKTEETKADKTDDTKGTEAAKQEKATYTVKVVDENNQPLANVKVQLCLVEKTTVVTDATGTATFADMVVDKYAVQLEELPDGYKAEKYSYFFDEGATEMTIQVKSPASQVQKYTVTVVDENAAPVAGAKVTFTKESGNSTITTQAEGTASLNSMMADYTITVEAPEGYNADTTEYKFAEGTYELTITLTAVSG